MKFIADADNVTATECCDSAIRQWRMWQRKRL